MNSRRRDILIIAVALLAILGVGFGLGSLVAKRTLPANPGPPSVQVDNLEGETLAALQKSLALTPEQAARIRPAIRNTCRKVLDTRRQALLDYYRHMLRLHDEIAPELSPEQQKILLRNRKLLEDTIEKRFSRLLSDEDAPEAGVPENPEEQR